MAPIIEVATILVLNRFGKRICLARTLLPRGFSLYCEMWPMRDYEEAD